jgi:hypothetical protein
MFGKGDVIHILYKCRETRMKGNVGLLVKVWIVASEELAYMMIITIILNAICGLLGYYAASCGNCLPTFRDNVSVPSSQVKSPSRTNIKFYRKCNLKI